MICITYNPTSGLRKLFQCFQGLFSWSSWMYKTSFHVMQRHISQIIESCSESFVFVEDILYPTVEWIIQTWRGNGPTLRYIGITLFEQGDEIDKSQHSNMKELVGKCATKGISLVLLLWYLFFPNNNYEENRWVTISDFVDRDNLTDVL